MSLSTISSSPSSKFNWADDDDNDFDLEAWKATADTSAPTAESLGPLQLPASSSSPSPTSYYYTTISSSPPNEEAPWRTITSPVTPPLVTATPAAVANPIPHDMDQFDGKVTAAWHALRDVPDPPAYPELNAWGVVRNYYAREWNAMKVRSGHDCRRGVLYRFSPLDQIWNAEYDQETVSLEQIRDCASVEELLLYEEALNVELLEKAAEVAEDLDVVSDYQEEEMVTRIELAHNDELELLRDINYIDVDAPLIVSSPAPAAEIIQICVEDSNMASSLESADSSSEPEKITFPIISSYPAYPTKAQEITEDLDGSSCEIDPLPTTTIKEVITISPPETSPPDLDDDFLSDPDSTSDSDSGSYSSSLSSLSLPRPTFTIAMPQDTYKISSVGIVLSTSPPLSPVCNAIQIGLSPASEFIQHKRRDSQEALGQALAEALEHDLDDEVIDVRVPDALHNATIASASDDEATEHDEQEDGDLNDTQDAVNQPSQYDEPTKHDGKKRKVATHVSDKAAKGWDYLSNMSRTTTAVVIGVGVVLGGCLHFTRHR